MLVHLYYNGYVNVHVYIQWILSNLDIIGSDYSVLNREVSSIQRLSTQMWFLGQMKVSSLTRCPQVWIERFHCTYVYVLISVWER